jgi:ribosomal protein S18 acetylase RimI-like enzyme
MVHPDYQRRGIGRMTTRKCNEVADAAGKATFARTRPISVKLFESEGFRTLEEIEVPYEDFKMERGRSQVFAMKREVGGV